MANVESDFSSSDEIDSDFDDASLSDDDELNTSDQLIVYEEDLSGGSEDAKLNEVPKLVFVNEKNIAVLVDQDSPRVPEHVFGKSMNVNRKLFECPHCGKQYTTSERWYKYHLDRCDKNVAQAISSSTDAIDNNDDSESDTDSAADKEIFQRGITYLANAFEEAIVYPYFNLAEPGLSVGKLARSVKSKMLSLKQVNDNENEEIEDGDECDDACKAFRTYGRYLLDIFESELVKDAQFIIKKTAATFQKFYNYCVDEDEINRWDNFLQDLEIAADAIHRQPLYNFVMNSFLRQCISSLIAQNEKNISLEDIPITKSEEETMYYVAGFIVFSLKKGVKRKLSSDSKAIIALLDGWGCKGDNEYGDINIEEYVRAWLEKVNRGGLFHVNSEFYDFVVAIEKTARTILNISLFSTYTGQNLKEVLQQKFEASLAIQNAWKNLSSGFTAGDELKHKLFKKLIVKWINVRAYAFVKVWMQQYKLDQRKAGEDVSEQGEPALRKGLKKKAVKKRKVDRTLISPKKKVTPAKKSSKDKTSKASAAASKLQKAKNILNKKKK